MSKILVTCAYNPQHDDQRKHGCQSLKKTARRAAKAALADLDLPKATEIGILITDDAEVRRLNWLHRKRNQPTNVLSFALEEGEKIPSRIKKKCRLLGDIVLAYETVVQEAEERQIPMKHHLTHLVIHGVLHLLGHDHERSPKEAKQQEKRETTLLVGMGYADPYA